MREERRESPRDSRDKTGNLEVALGGARYCCAMRVLQLDAVHQPRIAQERRIAEEQSRSTIEEHRGVGADAESEGENDAEGETRAWRGARARRSAGPGRPIRGAWCRGRRGSLPLHVSTPPKARWARRTASAWEIPLALVFLGFALDVKSQLVGELALDIAAPNERAGAIEEVIPPLAEHGSPLPLCFYRGKISSRLVREVQRNDGGRLPRLAGPARGAVRLASPYRGVIPPRPPQQACNGPGSADAAASRRAAPPARQSSPRTAALNFMSSGCRRSYTS